MTYSELKKQHQDKYTELFDEIGMFWAFSNEQFNEGKAKNPVTEGHKYVSIGMGGYFPGQNKKRYAEGMAAIDAWHKEATAQVKADALETEKAILYELNNYECFYSGDIDDVVDLFEGTYTVDEIRKVYRKYVGKPTSPAMKEQE